MPVEPLSVLFLCAALLPAAGEGPPRTVAESSDYKETSRHADVVAFCKSLAKQSSLVRLSSLGTSHEGRDIPLVIVADPPVSSAAEAAKSKKLVVLAMGNIHAGEVDGKEALLMLARDLALAKERPWLKELILVFAPLFNADGNEKMGKHRPSQAGPVLVGTRANAQALDLNRDFIKLESPEVRALVGFFNTWDPAVVIDCHTTNGSRHRYALTYEGGRCPAGGARVVAFTRDDLLPQVNRDMQKRTGYRSFFYGNFSPDRARWETVPAVPRFGTHYVGLRNRLAILSESYSYASFRDRVLASKAFVEGIGDYTARHAGRIRTLLAEARAATVKAGQAPGEKDRVVLQQKAVAQGRPVNVLGFVEETRDGKRRATDRPHAYEVQYMGGTEATLSVRRPFAYLLPARLGAVVATLRRHGVVVEELREAVEVEVEAYRVERITRTRTFQKHRPVALQVAARKERRRLPAGSIVVRTAQPLGSLAVYLLEPQSADGLVTWNFFDAVLKEGEDYPVLRVPEARALAVRPLRPSSEER
jgi:hypothetical protein